MSDAPDFAKLLALLTSQNVDFIVVGEVALGFSGFVRTTDRIDAEMMGQWERESSQNPKIKS